MSTPARPNILYVGPFDVSSSNANALRVRGMAKALAGADCDVTILGGMGNEQTLDPGFADGLRNGTVNEYNSGALSFLPAGIRGLFLGDVSARSVRSLTPRPDAVIGYGTHLGYILRFKRLCSELGIPLFLDVVEWYQASDLPGGRFGPFAIANELSMRTASPGVDGIFAISSRLAEHYRGKGCHVLQVPPLFEPHTKVSDKMSANDGRLHLCYAGTPGKKEAFELLLKGLERAHDHGADFVFHIVGMTESALAQRFDVGSLKILAPESKMAVFYGQVPNVRAREIIASSDFSMLFRPLRKANQYGFPSKFAESLSLGTPVMANDFSDIKSYLRHEHDGYLLPHLDELLICEAVLAATKLPLDARRRMSDNALATAKASFSIEKHSSAIGAFMKEGISGRH